MHQCIDFTAINAAVFKNLVDILEQVPRGEPKRPQAPAPSVEKDQFVPVEHAPRVEVEDQQAPADEEVWVTPVELEFPGEDDWVPAGEEVWVTPVEQELPDEDEWVSAGEEVWVAPVKQEPRREIERQPFEPVTMLIRAGKFVMGTSEAQIIKLRNEQIRERAKWTELPQRTLNLPDYWIGRYPVTVEEFAVFVRAGGYNTAEYWSSEGWAKRFEAKWTTPRLWDESRWTGDDRQPVIGVSWFEAQAYCRWLSIQTGRSYRLPLEAEWEKAARGTKGRIFPWGDEWEESRCNTVEARMNHTTPVDKFSPKGDSPFGIADMAGNVWEWCRSGWVDEYVYPEGRVPSANRRVVRSGAWDQMQDLVRSAVRHWRAPGDFANNIGFRVVWSTEPIDEAPIDDETRRMAISPMPPEPLTDTGPDVQPPERLRRRGPRHSWE
jgi:formylglycine-generating enzyme required for sulfatase activity